MKVVLASVVCLAACGESEYAALFDRYDSRVSDNLYGTWSAHFEMFVSRWVIDADRVMFVNRCDLDTYAAVDVGASVSDTEIRLLESAQTGDSDCSATATSGTTVACATSPSTNRNCFEHEGFVLTVYDATGVYGIFTKYSDETF